MSEQLSVSVVDASGSHWRRAASLLLGHPHVRVQQVTSERNAGNLSISRTQPARPHQAPVRQRRRVGTFLPAAWHAMSKIEHYAASPRYHRSQRRLPAQNPDDYVRWYGKAHSNPCGWRNLLRPGFSAVSARSM
jgi:hypothetical protein